MRLLPRIALVACLALVAHSAWAAPAKTENQYDAMKRFSNAYDQVRRTYVRDMGNDELMDGAIKGMLQSLDPHSTFLNKNDYKEMKETTQGEFFGIGIEISMENNQLIVVSPIEDTPAYKAGLKAGDAILGIDGLPTQDMSLQEAVSKIRGAKGSPVELLILHKDSKVPDTVTIVRDTIPLISVKSRFLDEDGFLWLRLTRFSSKTTDELDEALAAAQKKAPIKGIVLDLRNNPGGLLDQSVSVAERFLKSGTVVSMRGRGGEIMQKYDVSNARNIPKMNVPMVVLVNSGSASASEIVAGALQDHKRALLVGERSFGKGSVQNLVPLGDDTAIKLTIALYYTPSGRSIQAEGIVPDIELPFEVIKEDEKDAKLARFFNTREKDLSGHLEKNATKQADAAPTNATAKEVKKNKLVEEETLKILGKDNQLRMGLQMVRSLPRMSEIKSQ